MDDAFDLPKPKENIPAPLEIPPAPPSSHNSVQAALAHLTQVKAYALTFAGKDGMNPHLWLQKRKVEYLLRKLSKAPTTEDVEEALTIKTEEPNINLFLADYEPDLPPPPSRPSPYRRDNRG